MAIYDFRCKVCGATTETQSREPELSCCGRPLSRVWSFQAAPVWQSHFNHTTGTLISDPREFDRALRDKSDEQTQRTGIPHNYIAADHSDIKTLGVTDEGLKETHDRMVRTGEIAAGSKPVL